MTHGIRFRLTRFARWLFGSPFRDLPPAFGNTVPPELRAFEAEAAEAGPRLGRGCSPGAGAPPQDSPRTFGILDGAAVAAAAEGAAAVAARAEAGQI